MAVSKKRQGLSLMRKIEILDAVQSQPEKKRTEIANEFGIPLSTLSNILRHKEKYRKEFHSGTRDPLLQQRNRGAKHEEIDAQLLQWFSHMRSEDIPVSGPVLKAKAEELSSSLGLEDWKCSGGWLSRWKKRHNIIFKLPTIWSQIEVLQMASCEVWHKGGCHCGAVSFRVLAPTVIKAIDCNCSICKKKQNIHFIVAESKFELIKGKENLTTYTFNTGQAKHMFCKTCGVQSFYKPRSNPDGYGIMPHCLDPETVERVDIETFDGANWEKSIADSDVPSRSKLSFFLQKFPMLKGENDEDTILEEFSEYQMIHLEGVEGEKIDSTCTILAKDFPKVE